MGCLRSQFPGDLASALDRAVRRGGRRGAGDAVSYVIAAYGVTILSLVVYVAMLLRERRRQEDERSR